MADVLRVTPPGLTGNCKNMLLRAELNYSAVYLLVYSVRNNVDRSKDIILMINTLLISLLMSPLLGHRPFL
jgi:hypothetical protein